MKFSAEKGVFSFEFSEDGVKRILTIDIPKRTFYQNDKAMQTFNVFYNKGALGKAKRALENDIYYQLVSGGAIAEVKTYEDLRKNAALENKLIAYLFLERDIKRGKNPELWAIMDMREKLVRSGLYRIDPKSLIDNNLSINKTMIKDYARYIKHTNIRYGAYWGLTSYDDWQVIKSYIELLNFREKYPDLEWSFDIFKDSYHGCDMSLEKLSKREMLYRKSLEGLDKTVIRQFNLQTIFFHLVSWESQTNIKINYKTNNIMRTYQKALSEYNSVIDKKTDENIEKILDPKFNWEKDNYIFYQPKTSLELRKEADQQRNCLKSYIEKYSRGETIIILMRKKSNLEKSFVTLEIKQILGEWISYQQKKRFNADVSTTSDEGKVIREYLECLNKGE